MTSEIRGNLHHEINPVIGWLRLAIADGKTLSVSQMEAAVEKLSRAIAESNKLKD